MDILRKELAALKQLKAAAQGGPSSPSSNPNQPSPAASRSAGSPPSSRSPSRSRSPSGGSARQRASARAGSGSGPSSRGGGSPFGQHSTRNVALSRDQHSSNTAENPLPVARTSNDPEAREAEREALVDWLRAELRARKIGVSRLMQTLDGNRSNTVTMGEFITGLQEMGVVLEREEFMRVFKAVDLDGGNQVTREELEHTLYAPKGPTGGAGQGNDEGTRSPGSRGSSNSTTSAVRPASARRGRPGTAKGPRRDTGSESAGMMGARSGSGGPPSSPSRSLSPASPSTRRRGSRLESETATLTSSKGTKLLQRHVKSSGSRGGSPFGLHATRNVALSRDQHSSNTAENPFPPPRTSNDPNVREAERTALLRWAQDQLKAKGVGASRLMGICDENRSNTITRQEVRCMVAHPFLILTHPVWPPTTFRTPYNCPQNAHFASLTLPPSPCPPHFASLTLPPSRCPPHFASLPSLTLSFCCYSSRLE